jgi:hypothetical protein
MLKYESNSRSTHHACEITQSLQIIELSTAQIQLVLEQLLPTPSELKGIGDYLDKHPDGKGSLGTVSSMCFST